jgi:membrane-bound serine protease (ClpP class)
VHVHGERWQAVTSVPLHDGEPIRVTAIDGLMLGVEPLGTPDKGEP